MNLGCDPNLSLFHLEFLRAGYKFRHYQPLFISFSPLRGPGEDDPPPGVDSQGLRLEESCHQTGTFFVPAFDGEFRFDLVPIGRTGFRQFDAIDRPEPRLDPQLEHAQVQDIPRLNVVDDVVQTDHDRSEVRFINIDGVYELLFFRFNAPNIGGKPADLPFLIGADERDRRITALSPD